VSLLALPGVAAGVLSLINPVPYVRDPARAYSTASRYLADLERPRRHGNRVAARRVEFDAEIDREPGAAAKLRLVRSEI
jgi:hypothetical protein